MDRCEDEVLLSGLLDGELSQPDERRVRTHLRQCTRCRRLLDEMKSVERGLASVPTPGPARWQQRWLVVAGTLSRGETAPGGPGAEAPPAVRSARGEFRRWLSAPRSRWALAAAACLVALLAVLWALSPSRPRGAPRAVTAGPSGSGWQAVELASADSVEVEIEPGEAGPGALLVLSPDGEVAFLWVAAEPPAPGVPDI